MVVSTPNFLLQKYARQMLGTHNVDHCARLCHASTVAGLSMAYGSVAVSNTLMERRRAAVFLIGSNPTEQHPVFGTMLCQAVRKRGMPLVVADPRHRPDGICRPCTCASAPAPT
jgi:formate dehydrogenase major subunit/formate dehydrogenase alpha subunit